MCDFTQHMLDECHSLGSGLLPEKLQFSDDDFETLWKHHPKSFNEIWLHGQLVKIPRWQQAYGSDYYFSGQVNRALPMLEEVKPLLEWSRAAIHAKLNGVLLNWYDGTLGHYIGAHRDSTTKMVSGAPIVTISLGEQRVFRLRPWKQKSFRDFAVPNNSVMVVPFETNLAYTHEIPRFVRNQGRRISITLRAFEQTLIVRT